MRKKYLVIIPLIVIFFLVFFIFIASRDKDMFSTIITNEPIEFARISGGKLYFINPNRNFYKAEGNKVTEIGRLTGYQFNISGERSEIFVQNPVTPSIFNVNNLDQKLKLNTNMFEWLDDSKYVISSSIDLGREGGDEGSLILKDFTNNTQIKLTKTMSITGLKYLGQNILAILGYKGDGGITSVDLLDITTKQITKLEDDFAYINHDPVSGLLFGQANNTSNLSKFIIIDRLNNTTQVKIIDNVKVANLFKNGVIYLTSTVNQYQVKYRGIDGNVSELSGYISIDSNVNGIFANDTQAYITTDNGIYSVPINIGDIK